LAIKVLIVDDSALMRALLTEIINGAPDLDVVGAAPDPIAAREMIKSLNPDVLTLDVEMPKMDGLEFLTRIMRLRPMPVVMISSLTDKGSEVTLQALETGAVDFVAKPRAENASQLMGYAEEICDKIRGAYGARLRGAPRPARTADAVPPALWPGDHVWHCRGGVGGVGGIGGRVLVLSARKSFAPGTKLREAVCYTGALLAGAKRSPIKS